MCLRVLWQGGRRFAQHVIQQPRQAYGALTVATAASLVGWFVVTQLHSNISTQSSLSIHSSELKSAVQFERSDTMPDIRKLREEAFWGLFVADSLSMPVHWYYDPYDIKRDFDGWLTGYAAPKAKHPSSILTISAVGGAGRSMSSKRSKPVIGDVILHDKLKYWTKRDRSVHYHQGMSAGDNTLNAILAVKAALQASQLDSDVATEKEVMSAILTDYVKFMTTPGSHNDTYAESALREFFRDWSDGGSPTQPEEVMKFVEKRSKSLEGAHLDHNIDSVGALVHPTPIILHYANQSQDVAAKNAVRLSRLTLASVSLDPFIDVYARTLHTVLNGASLKEKAEEALKMPPVGNAATWKVAQRYSRMASEYSKGSEKRLEVYQSAVGQLGLACYIKGAMSSLFFLAYEFHDDFENGVLTNTNCGGENCHRGAALGALLGAEAARTGKTIPQRFKQGLHSQKNDILSVLDLWQ